MPTKGLQYILTQPPNNPTSWGSGELLKEDDSLLRNTLFTTLRHHHPKLAAKLDVIFALSSAWSLTESDSDFQLLEQRLSDLNPSELILVRAVVQHAFA